MQFELSKRFSVSRQKGAKIGEDNSTLSSRTQNSANKNKSMKKISDDKEKKNSTAQTVKNSSYSL